MRIATWIFCIAAVAYVVARAIIIPLTVDEAWTYLGFVPLSVWDIVTAANPAANNHILNTLLVKLNLVCSHHELSLRLPNILAFVLFLYSYYKISGFYFSQRSLRLLFLIAITLNAALLRFFALSRGYGLAIGLLSFSFLQLFQLAATTDNKNKTSLHLALLFAVLATYANFTVLNAALGVFMCSVYLQYYNGERKPGNLLGIPALYFGLLLLLCAYPLYRMNAFGELYYGGVNNFIDDTVASMIEDMASYVFLHGNQQLLMWSTTDLIGLLFVVSLSLWLKGKLSSTQFIAPFLLFLAIAAINLQFYLFGSRLVVHRGALYLYPLFIMSFFAILRSLKEFKTVIYSLTILLVGVLVFFFQYEAGVTNIREWWFDENNKKVLSYVTKHHKRPGKIKFYGFSLTSNSFNYYIQTRYKDVIEETPCCIDDVSKINLAAYDFLYLKKDDDVAAYPDLKPVRSYAEGNFILYEKQQ
ncbi:MAG: hypothetical protein K0R82_2561 [Flavipsychrobacter sp.]|nr:hypothetical protein [Flavipsychrobacter sp.]